MTSCEVKVIADSISPDQIRLTTLQLRYWRPIHAELMTHRVFSRNARSSRAVPVVTLLKENPYYPRFQRNQPGMQAAEELPLNKMALGHMIWGDMIKACREGCKNLHELGVHKQWANRPLEWFGWIDVLVTSTDWANWFALRDHSDAAPEIHELAGVMAQELNASEPNPLSYGEWHLPYILPEELDGISWYDEATVRGLKMLSTARCARLSYKPFDGEADIEKEQARYDKLVVAQPVHASPAEHQATPDFMTEVDLGKGQTIKFWQNAKLQGNFYGWEQNRKSIPNEAVFDDHYLRSY